MTPTLKRVSSILVLTLFGGVTSFLMFQNCSPVRFAANDTTSFASSASCDASTYGSKPYTNGDVSGICSCTSGAIICTPTGCVDPSSTFVGGVCTGTTVSSLSVLINGQTSVSLVPSPTAVPVQITATGAITSLTTGTGISKVSGSCSLTSVTASQLSVPGGQFVLGSQSLVYNPTLALGMAGCTWRITGVANNGRSSYADFTTLLCSAGTADPAHPTCTTSDGLTGHTVCASDGLSYQCVPNTSQNCTFNNQTIASGSSITAYPSNTVPYGSSCTGQTRTCQNGVLSGSGSYSTCSVTPGASCTFNGQQISNGTQVTGYAASTVAYGATCSSGPMVCQNGTLIGSDPYPTCSVQGNPNCNYNGKTLLNGQSITLFQNSSVAYGSSCVSETLLCSNGSITGSSSGTNYYQNASCSVQAPANCSFNGAPVANGASVTAWQDASVNYGSTCQSQSRVCTNGSLSGSYTNAGCTVKAGATCSYNGQQIATGQTVSGYASASVGYGSSCQSASATCDNGTLSATIYPTCSAAAPSNCTLNGATILNGASTTAYSQSNAPYGSSCSSQVRTCSNGSLSGDGSYQYSSCQVAGPASCNFQGTTYADGQQVTAYLASSVPFGSSCQSQVRTCHNGTFDGSAQYTGCSVAAPANCSFLGQTIAHGQTVTAYSTSSGPSCPSEVATCYNGSLGLDAGYTNQTCTIVAPVNPLLGCSWLVVPTTGGNAPFSDAVLNLDGTAMEVECQGPSTPSGYAECNQASNGAKHFCGPGAAGTEAMKANITCQCPQF